MAVFRRWTPEMKQWLENNFRLYGDLELSEMMTVLFPHPDGWTLKSVEKRRMYSGLKRTREELKAIWNRNGEQGRYKGRYDQIDPWDQRGRTPVGTIMRGARSHPQIMTEAGAVYYHRWLWEQHHGPVSDGCLIIFRDGANRRHFTVADLLCVTRKEHTARFHAKGSVGRSLNYVIGMMTQNKPELRAFIKKTLPEIGLLQQALYQQKINNEQHH